MSVRRPAREARARALLLASIAFFTCGGVAHAQAWRNCIPDSIGPGGCDSIAPGGGRSIAPRGGMSIGPGGGWSIGPGSGQSIGPGGGRSIAPGGGLATGRDWSRGLDPDTMRPAPPSERHRFRSRQEPTQDSHDHSHFHSNP
jgi:hypothetical protein